MAEWKDDAYLDDDISDEGPCTLALRFEDTPCGEVGSDCSGICCQEQANKYIIDHPILKVQEWKVVDPKTGGAKGQKRVQLSMAPVPFLEDLGRLYAMGAEKYGRNNWRQGYKWSLTLDALYRHLLEVQKGNWLDDESGLPHVVHIAWHCATLHTFDKEGLGENDLW